MRARSRIVLSIPMTWRSSAALVAVLAGVLLVGCVNVEIAPQDFPYQVMLTAGDLGPGWQVDQTSVPQVEGALSSYSLAIVCGNSDDVSQPFVAHTLTTYPDEASAKAGFMNLQDQYILSKPSDPTLDITPRSESDLADSHCERLRMNDQPRISCVWIQQHSTSTVFIHGLADQQALTVDTFVELVRTLDARLGLLDEGKFVSGKTVIET
jgi:hypothetical protein